MNQKHQREGRAVGAHGEEDHGRHQADGQH